MERAQPITEDSRVSQGQLSLNFTDSLGVSHSPAILNAVDTLARSTGIEERGAIYTRVEVVNFILDLVGYTEDKTLFECRLLEPSFGGGDFLIPAIKRLLASWLMQSGDQRSLDSLESAIRAVELHESTFDTVFELVFSELLSVGLSESDAVAVAEKWLIQGDFLLEDLHGSFDFVVGNPPYVRQELILAPLLEEYRRRYTTMYDRADLYIPFIERSLSLLSSHGNLGFICADRWMKNRYGGPLRAYIADRFHMKIYVDMVNTQAFHRDVTAYPAITVICRDHPGPTRIARSPRIVREDLSQLSKQLLAPEVDNSESSVREMAQVTDGSEPWLLETSDQMSLIRRLERTYPCIEETGCKIGIGVATGADRAFIGAYDELDVEPDRKVRLATTKDIASGKVVWRGQGVINPFAQGRGLVDLSEYPKLRRYLEDRKDIISKRHCAKKAPDSWYRTIDRISPDLTRRPKLLIPDIKGEAHVVFEEGRLYPHHNLYYVVSDIWDIRALQAVLLSSVTRLFVSTYSTKMRGGFLRFQAQYLRRLRLPQWKDVPPDIQVHLTEAARALDMKSCNEAVCRLYNLTAAERVALGSNGA